MNANAHGMHRVAFNAAHVNVILRHWLPPFSILLWPIDEGRSSHLQRVLQLAPGNALNALMQSKVLLRVSGVRCYCAARSSTNSCSAGVPIANTPEIECPQEAGRVCYLLHPIGLQICHGEIVRNDPELGFKWRMIVVLSRKLAPGYI
jgi:hypothetical protein